MAGPTTTFQRRLVRDGLQTPWGFRLQGGKDFNQPLTVQRVFTGSPAEGELQRGDVVIAINNRDTNTLYHKEALDIIKRSGSDLLLSVQRGPNRYQAPTTPTTPQGYRPVQFSTSGPVPVSPTKNPTYGVQYGPAGGQSGPMLNRVQESLQMAAYSRPEDEEDYDYKTVNQRRAVFQQAPASSGGPRRHPQSRGRKWQPPSTGGGMTFGWAPSVKADPNYRPGPPVADGASEFKPVRQAGPQHHHAPPRPVPAQSFVSEVDEGPPAWKGSLKRAGSSTPSGAYKSVQFNPNQPAGINPIRINQPQAGVNEGPQVVHLQYNSPLGLYNKNSAEEALRGQTAGKPGQGTLYITGGDGKQEIDWQKSHVYQMIHGPQQTGPQAARYVEHGDNEIHYDGYQDHSRQSRSFRALADSVADDEGLGASDF